MSNIFGDSRKADSNGVPYELSRDELYTLSPHLNPANSGMDDMQKRFDAIADVQKLILTRLPEKGE